MKFLFVNLNSIFELENFFQFFIILLMKFLKSNKFIQFHTQNISMTFNIQYFEFHLN